MTLSKKSDPQTYTKPALRDRIKKKVLAGDKGGDTGQWSARKAQMTAREYEEKGGGYKKPRNESQKSLQTWDDKKPAASRKKKTKKKAPAQKP